MVGWARMIDKDLGSKLRPPLIDQFMKIYKEEVVEFEDTANIVTQAMIQLDEVLEEGEEQAQHKDLSK